MLPSRAGACFCSSSSTARVLCDIARGSLAALSRLSSCRPASPRPRLAPVCPSTRLDRALRWSVYASLRRDPSLKTRPPGARNTPSASPERAPPVGRDATHGLLSRQSRARSRPATQPRASCRYIRGSEARLLSRSLAHARESESARSLALPLTRGAQTHSQIVETVSPIHNRGWAIKGGKGARTG